MMESSYEELSDFEDDATDSGNEEIPEVPAKRRRGAARIWIKEQDFQSADSALKFVTQEVRE